MKKKHIFNWNNGHRRAFEKIKKTLTQALAIAYFDTAKRSLLIVDGSPLGICAILAQREKLTELYRIISYRILYSIYCKHTSHFLQLM